MAALSLPATERIYLSQRLLASISPAELEASQQDTELYQTLDRRVADLKDTVRAEDSWQDG